MFTSHGGGRGREGGGGRERAQANHRVLPHNMKLVQSPATFKRFFTIVIQDYNLLKHIARDFLCSNTQLRDFYNLSLIK